MAIAKKYSDLKFDGEKLSIKQYLQMEELPSVLRICSVESEDKSANSLTDMTVLMTRVSKEPFAHIKVLQFYDNAKMQSEKGGEYILEHETFVGFEYLLPLHFPRLVKFVRRPGRRGRYLTIKQVLGDRPAFVKAEDKTQARLSRDLNHFVTIQPKTILELKKIYTNKAGGTALLQCSADDMLYTFQEEDEVNFTVFEGDNLYTLTELSHTTLLPKVILFQEIDPEEAVLKDNELRSALLTMVEGPLEVLGFTEVEYLICWVRNKQRRTYETVLIPETLWNKIYVQKRSCFLNEFEKEMYIKRKFCHCSTSDFFRKLLYILPVNKCEVTWLRCPDLFKRNLNDANKLYEVVQTPFADSSDDDDDESRDNIYSTISEPPPPLPPKVPISSEKQTGPVKRNQSFVKKIKQVFTHVGINVSDTNKPERPPKPHMPEVSKILPQNLCQAPRPLPCLPSGDNNYHKYTKLNFTETSDTIYESADYSDKPTKSSEHNIPEKKTLPEISNLPESIVLRANQTEDDFFKYSVPEVSFCFKHCGLESLANLCTKQKLDGLFFKGFQEWDMFNLTRFEVAVVNKVIYHGWRPKTDRNEYMVQIYQR